MSRLAIKQNSRIQTTVYSTFKGADFSTDPSLVDRSRSPLCTNIVADGGGMPEKRPGWRVLHTLSDPVYGLFSGTFGQAERLLAHAGDTLYVWGEGEEEPEPVLEGLPEAKSRGVFLAGCLWIATGAGLIRYDGQEACWARDAQPYVPTVVITRLPTGGGALYENVNLLTPRRKNAFQTDGTSREFLLDSTVDEDTPVRVWVWGQEMTEDEDFTVDRAEGVLTMVQAPAAPGAGSADGLVVEFSSTVEGYADMADRCTILALCGIGADDRLVLSGNPDYPNRDWISAQGDPSYIPDLSYSLAGEETVPIQGYFRLGEYQAVVKADSGRDGTIFLRSGTLDGEGNAVFALLPAASGVGAVSPGSFSFLLDEPLFLAPTGISTLAVNDLTGRRAVQNRSGFLNAQLAREEGLAQAEAVAWKGMYLLAVGGGRVYVLDGRQERAYRSASQGDYAYEGYYWENVPAQCWLARRSGNDEALFFGTGDGRVCRFNTDMASVLRFSDAGEPVRAVWATKYDDDGSPALRKTMLRRGCCVTIKPYSRSSAQVYFRTDRTSGKEQPAAGDVMDILTWEDLDFERFTFSTDDSPQEIFFNRKVKNYKRLQIVVRNDQLNEGFGIFQITKQYIVGNFARR